MNLYGNLDRALAGLLDGMLSNTKIESGITQENIGFGKPVVGYVGEEEKVYNLHQDKVTLALSADLVASNVYTITINGTAVAGTYATSHAATMTALIASINANATLSALGKSITAAAGTTNRDIVITAKGLDLTVTGAVTLGASQATVTVTNATWAKFLGVSLFAQRGGKDIDSGSACYEADTRINIVSEGKLYVPVGAVAVKDKEAAYAIYTSGDTQGNFTNSASGNYDIGCYFRGNAVSNLAILEVRGLK